MSVDPNRIADEVFTRALKLREYLRSQDWITPPGVEEASDEELALFFEEQLRKYPPELWRDPDGNQALVSSYIAALYAVHADGPLKGKRMSDGAEEVTRQWERYQSRQSMQLPLLVDAAY